MPVEKVQLGPFVGALNSFSDPTAIEDTEVSQLVNFEPDIDGSLVNRPPIGEINVPIPGGAGAGLNVLGFYEADTGAKYLIASNRLSSTYYFTGDAWVLITDTIAATAMAQFRNDLWLVAPPGSSNNGGKWSLSGSFTSDANMPKGGCVVVYKDRIWVGPGQTATANGSRLYLSNVNAVWPVTPNFLNIGSGDGQNIIDLAIYAESVLVFKRGSTYRYAFSTDPSTGIVSRISDNIGALAKNCWTSYQNDLYVLFDNKVYQFTNYNYNQLNVRVPLVADNPLISLNEAASISVWADRLFVQYYDNTYVYSLRTRAWTTWKSTRLQYMGKVWAIPGEQGLVPRAYTFSSNSEESQSLFVIKDVIDLTTEPMTCLMVTKNYDYLNPDSFKRLLSWGADVMSKVSITSTATPVDSVRQLVTWDYLKNNGITWGQLKAQGATWDRLLDQSLTVVDSVPTEGSGTGRKFVKFHKSLRFRQIGFKLEVQTNGDVSTAPVRLFNIITRTAEKQDVSKKIS